MIEWPRLVGRQLRESRNEGATTRFGQWVVGEENN